MGTPGNVYCEERPWGRFEILYEEERLKIKRITVHPGKRLSLQSHEYRSEIWVVLQGEALVTRGKEEMTVPVHHSVFIPPRSRHRMSNPGSEDVVFVEVQRGSYLGEDDITRYQDDFDRI